MRRFAAETATAAGSRGRRRG